jgi:hypothetical protein
VDNFIAELRLPFSAASTCHGTRSEQSEAEVSVQASLQEIVCTDEHGISLRAKGFTSRRE